MELGHPRGGSFDAAYRKSPLLRLLKTAPSSAPLLLQLQLLLWTLCCNLTLAVQEDSSSIPAAVGEIISGDYCHAETFRASCGDGGNSDMDSITSGNGNGAAAYGSHAKADDEVIVIDAARYGRMELGRCVELDVMGHLGCQSDVLALVDRRCSGRRRCEIRVPDAELESTRPCSLRELKTYLHVTYRCIPVESVTGDQCRTDRVLPVSRPTSGFIASVVTSDTPSCADGRRPWIIRAEPGQQVSLTLYDFFSTAVSSTSTPVWSTPMTSTVDDVDIGVGNRRQLQKRNFSDPTGLADQSGRAPNVGLQPDMQRLLQDRSRRPSFEGGNSDGERQTTTTCREYALVQDGDDSGGLTTLCGGTSRRVSEPFLSTGHVVRIWIKAGIAPRDFQRFIIAYNVVGCADPTISTYTWFRRSSEGHALAGCLTSDVAWSLNCINGSWIGQAHNCSPPAPVHVPRQSGLFRHAADNDGAGAGSSSSSGGSSSSRTGSDEDHGVDDYDDIDEDSSSLLQDSSLASPSQRAASGNGHFVLLIAVAISTSAVIMATVVAGLARLVTTYTAERRRQRHYTLHSQQQQQQQRDNDLSPQTVIIDGPPTKFGRQAENADDLRQFAVNDYDLASTNKRYRGCPLLRATSPASGMYQVRRQTEEFESDFRVIQFGTLPSGRPCKLPPPPQLLPVSVPPPVVPSISALVSVAETPTPSNTVVTWATDSEMASNAGDDDLTAASNRSEMLYPLQIYESPSCCDQFRTVKMSPTATTGRGFGTVLTPTGNMNTNQCSSV